MNTMKKTASFGALLVLVFFVLYSGPIFDTKFRLSAFITEFPETFSGNAFLHSRIAQLNTENENLRRQLGDNSIVPIKVYSSYPFVGRSEIVISAGHNEGIKEGDAVIVGGNIIVGKVSRVLEHQSVVTTVFDPSWEIPVRVGTKEIDALLAGGNELTLILIPDNVQLEVGERVVTAGRSLPYGLEVGFVRSISGTPAGVFSEAVINPSFQINELRDVEIYR